MVRAWRKSLGATYSVQPACLTVLLCRRAEPAVLWWLPNAANVSRWGAQRAVSGLAPCLLHATCEQPHQAGLDHPDTRCFRAAVAGVCRCARCGHITTAPPSGGPDMAQLSCTNPQCRAQLMYPRGASQVQCSLCSALNDATQANQLGHVVCQGCHITLMYAYGAQSVKCALCNHVTPAPSGSSSLGAAQQHQHQQPAASLSSKPTPTTAVLVEHPATLDEAGNEVPSAPAIGVTTHKGPAEFQK